MSNLTDQHIADALQAYVDNITAGDLDGVINLFAEDAIVEDPVGSDPHKGHAALREFYKVACESVGKMTLEGNVRVCSNFGACAMLASPKGAEDSLVIETLDVMEFNSEGKITSMRAYWGERNMKAL